MRYEPAGEKTMMVKKQGADDVYIKNIRLKLVVLLSVESVVIGIYLTLQIIILCSYYKHNDKIDISMLIELLITIGSFLYLTAFIVVLIRYIPVAILFFTYLTLIQMISGFILLTLAIMALITSLTLINRVGIDIIVDMILIIVGFSVIILSMLIILSLLHLMKLIKT